MTNNAVTKNTPAGHLRSALLAWECQEAFDLLESEWRTAYRPSGPAEEALINQLVWIEWRKRRLSLGERALHMAQLHARTGSMNEYGTSDGLVKRALVDQSYRLRKFDSRTSIATTPEDDRDLAAYAEDAAARLTKMLSVLDEREDYAGALEYLEEDTGEWWEDECNGSDERFTEDCEGLRAFLKIKLEPWLGTLSHQARERGAVRLQAYGESLDPARLGTLLALDERLTRQFEKALGMLIKIQNLREAAPSRPAAT